MPDKAAGDPHTLVFDRNVTSGSRWQQGNFVGKLTSPPATVRLIRVPRERVPYGIGIDRDNRPGSSSSAATSSERLIR